MPAALVGSQWAIPPSACRSVPALQCPHLTSRPHRRGARRAQGAPDAQPTPHAREAQRTPPPAQQGCSQRHGVVNRAMRYAGRAVRSRTCGRLTGRPPTGSRLRRPVARISTVALRRRGTASRGGASPAAGPGPEGFKGELKASSRRAQGELKASSRRAQGSVLSAPAQAKRAALCGAAA